MREGGRGREVRGRERGQGKEKKTRGQGKRGIANLFGIVAVKSCQ